MRKNREKKPLHLILFDGECGLCHRTVRSLLRYDRRRRFAYAPLQGETAKQFGKEFDMTSLVLVERWQTAPHFCFRGKAVLRICWHLGGFWKCLGIWSFFPNWLVNLIYRFVSRHRHVLGRGASLLSEEEASQGLFLS